MAPKVKKATAKNTDNNEESVSFSRVTAVASRWMQDFMFVSLCRRFKEEKLEEFNEILSVFEALYQNPSLGRDVSEEKCFICAFLARVMHGKQLDVQFEQDEHVMPLMSAVKIWQKLENTVDESVFENINILLLVQSVAICLEKGERNSALSALKWLENNHVLPQKLGVKLATVVTKRDTYHPFLTSFSFSRLLDAVKSYLDAYLEKNPSDYLLKAATETALSSRDTEVLEDEGTREGAQSETDNDSTQTEPKKKENPSCLRIKRKLLSTKINDMWSPDSCKKLCVSVRRTSKTELSQLMSTKPMDTTTTAATDNRKKGKQKWTPELDKYLKEGVKRHGLGKWSRILLDYNFEGRTGTMLKDRWRVLVRAYEVSEDGQ